MANITINGQDHNLQNFVTSTMKLLMRAKAIPQSELTQLQDSNYCRLTFNLHYPLFSNNPNAFNNDGVHSRYYAQSTFYEQNLYLCNDWYDHNAAPYLDWFFKFLPTIQ